MSSSNPFSLPVDVLDKILVSLDVQDLGRLICTCRLLWTYIPTIDALWKGHCRRYWLLEDLPPNARSWYQQWLTIARSDWWPYRDCYASVKESWNTIESVLSTRCTSAYRAIASSKGANEEEIKLVEKKIDTLLPCDYKCSLRIHGQGKIHLGSLKFYSHESSYFLLGASSVFQLDLDVVETGIGHESEAERKRETLLVLGQNNSDEESIHPYSELLVAPKTTNESSSVIPGGYVRTVYSRTISTAPPVGVLWASEATLTFSQWLREEATKILHYHVAKVNRHLTRFTLQPMSVALTKYFTVKVGVALDPSFGMWQNELLHNSSGFGYHIVITLSPDAPEEESCQLRCRHWDLDFTSSGNTVREVVDGDGVIGQYPTFRPGDQFEYASYTSVRGESLTMSGYLEMQYLSRHECFKVTIPPFHMEKPSFVTFVAHDLHSVR